MVTVNVISYQSSLYTVVTDSVPGFPIKTKKRSFRKQRRAPENIQ